MNAFSLAQHSGKSLGLHDQRLRRREKVAKLPGEGTPGKGLTVGEVRYVTETARRIAASDASWGRSSTRTIRPSQTGRWGPQVKRD